MQGHETRERGTAMTARAKIEGLTNAWYGFMLVSSLVSLVSNGLGFFSFAGHAAGLVVGFVLNFLIGRALLGRSSLVRVLLVAVSAVMTVLGSLTVLRLGWAFMQSWSVFFLGAAAWACAGVYMYVRSYRTLTDASVKAYFR
jgi:hypothetical protein